MRTRAHVRLVSFVNFLGENYWTCENERVMKKHETVGGLLVRPNSGSPGCQAGEATCPSSTPTRLARERWRPFRHPGWDHRYQSPTRCVCIARSCWCGIWRKQPVQDTQLFEKKHWRFFLPAPTARLVVCRLVLSKMRKGTGHLNQEFREREREREVASARARHLRVRVYVCVGAAPKEKR